MKEREPPKSYFDKCRSMGEQMASKNGSNTIVFTDHAVRRCYNRRIDPWKALMVVDNPDQRLDDQEIKGRRYERYVKSIGQRKVYVSLIREPKYIKNNKVEIIVLTSVAWRARGGKR
jgi:hypothetical protein